MNAGRLARNRLVASSGDTLFMAHLRHDSQMNSTVSAPAQELAPAVTDDAVERTSEVTDERRVYRAPTLRRLGSVRELTLGATGFLSDGAGTLKRSM